MLKLLLVDDEKLTLDLLENILFWEEKGIKIIGTARNVKQAKEFFTNNPPDILITDIRMPEEDGLDLIEWVREKEYRTKIIILSAYGEFEYAKKAMKYNTSGYILKPVEEEIIEEALDKVLNEIVKEKEIYTQYTEDYNLTRKILLRQLLLNKSEQKKYISLLEKEYSTTLFKSYNLICINTESVRYSDYVTINEMSEISKGKLIEFIKTESVFCCNETEIFENNPDEWIIVLNSDETAETIETGTKDLSYSITEKFKISIISSVSSRYKSLTDLYYSYQECRRYYSFKNLFPGNKLFSKNYLRKNLKPENINFDYFIDTAVKNIKSSNPDKLVYEIQCFISDISFIWKGQHLKLSKAVFSYLETLNRRYNLKDTVNITPDILYRSYPDIKQMEIFLTNKVKTIAATEKKENSSFHDSVIKIINYINDNYSSDISLEELCEIASISRHYLSTLFKKETGKTPWDFLTETRINNACSLIKSGSYRNYEIASMVGYENQGYFSRMFKKITGVSPSEYKRTTICN